MLIVCGGSGFSVFRVQVPPNRILKLPKVSKECLRGAAYKPEDGQFGRHDRLDK